MTQRGGAEELADFLFRQGIEGKSVLDINCGGGELCLGALARGAGRAVGWDRHPEHILKARRAAQVAGASAEFIEHDVERPDRVEAFDVVLCLDLLHRLRNPLEVLDTLARMTRERLIVEAGPLGAEGARRLGLARRRLLTRSPVIVVGRGGTSPPFDREARFAFSASALETVLTFHHHRFARVTTVKGPGNRVVVVAESRRIAHLVVVAGPMSSGKSRLIGEMRAGQHRAIGEALGITDLSAWPSVGARFLRQLREPHIERLILHYDFLRPFGRDSGSYEEDEALQVLEGAEVVSFVTLWTPPARLQAQHLESKITATPGGRGADPAHLPRPGAFLRGELAGRLPILGWIARRRHAVPSPRHLAVLGLYEHPTQVVESYRRWFDYCDRQAARTRDYLIVEAGEELKIYSRGEWEGQVQSHTE